MSGPATTTRIFFDGGCRPNPGAMEVAVVIRGVAHVRGELGQGSNGEAEWLALIEAATIARDMGLADVAFVGDSTMVVDQARGRTKCRGAVLQAHLARYRAIAAGFARVRVRQVGRSHNPAGLALERRHGSR